MKKTYLKLLTLLALITVLGVFSKTETVQADSVKAVSVVAKKSKKAKKTETINTRKQLIASIIKHVTNLDKKIKLKISKKVMKGKDEEFDRLFNDLSESMEYNEIMSYTDGWESSFYSFNKKYFTWEFMPKYKISKAEAKKLLSDITPVLSTKKELIESMVSHAENLDENFSVNVSNKTFDVTNEDEYKAFWDSLYEMPEYNDISRYVKNFNLNYNKYKNYSKIIITEKYDITKEEVDYLKNFVKTWVADNIKPEMTEEEKVRTINDFMVKEYRYTYGDNVQAPTDTLSCPDGKLGKYSVYSSFALVYGKGGVCDAKAKLFYRFAKEAGLDVIYITGDAGGAPHAWNMVKVDGNWYHIDVTWNRGQYEGSGEYDYYATRNYYLKSDDSMIKGEHTWDRTKYPAANTDYPLGPEHALPDDEESYDKISMINYNKAA